MTTSGCADVNGLHLYYEEHDNSCGGTALVPHRGGMLTSTSVSRRSPHPRATTSGDRT